MLHHVYLFVNKRTFELFLFLFPMSSFRFGLVSCSVWKYTAFLLWSYTLRPCWTLKTISFFSRFFGVFLFIRSGHVWQRQFYFFLSIWMFLFCLRPLSQPSVVCCDTSRFRLITRAAPLLFLYAVNFTFKLEKVTPKIERRERESEWFKLRFCFLFEPSFAFYCLHFWLISVAFGLADHKEAIAREKRRPLVLPSSETGDRNDGPWNWYRENNIVTVGIPPNKNMCYYFFFKISLVLFEMDWNLEAFWILCREDHLNAFCSLTASFPHLTVFIVNKWSF